MTNKNFVKVKIVGLGLALFALAAVVMLRSVGAAPNDAQQVATQHVNFASQVSNWEVLKSPFYNPLQVALLAWYPANSASSYTYSGATAGANGIAFDGTNIWVADENANEVVKWRASDGYCEPNANNCLSSDAGGPFGLAYDGHYMWVTNRDASSITILKRDMTPLLTCPTKNASAEPYNLAFDGTNMWVTNETDGVGTVEEWPNVASIEATPACPTTVVYDATTPCTFNVPTGIAYDNVNNTIWVANSANSGANTLTGIKGGVCTSHPGGKNPLFLAFDGKNIWATNHGATTVTFFNNGTHPHNLKAGKAPCGIVFDGKNMWISNETSSNVTVINTQTLVAVGTFTGNGMANPCQEAFDGANVWVINESATNTVDKM